MITDEDVNSICKAAYRVDPLNPKPEYHAGGAFFTSSDAKKQQWQIFEASANVNTGFQAMAAAPIIDGVVNESQIYLAFAGTNFDDRRRTSEE